jgi:hypothetical protein
VLYCSLVRSILEYCSVVWNPFSGNWVNKFETIQNRLLKLLASKLGLPINDLCSVAKQCGLDPLFNYVNFIYKLINSHIDCPELLTKIKFKVSTFNSCNHLLFHVNCHHQNYSYYSPLNRMCMYCNNSSNSIIFNDTPCLLYSLSIK